MINIGLSVFGSLQHSRMDTAHMLRKTDRECGIEQENKGVRERQADRQTEKQRKRETEGQKNRAFYI